MATPNLGLPTSPNGATDISGAYNPAMMLLDAVVQMSVQAITPTPPTTVAPGDVGKVWLIGPSATAAWAGKDGQVALCTAANVWAYFTPKDGWRCGSAGEIDYRYDAGTNTWLVQSPLVNPMIAEGDIIIGGPGGTAVRLAAGTEGQALTIDGDGSPAWEDGGAASFLGLSDTPDTYATFGGLTVRVKDDETGLEFVPGASGGTADGGNMSDTYVSNFDGIDGGAF